MKMDYTIDCIVGIDPGASGALAVWRPNAFLQTIPMPADIMQLREYFAHLKTICNNIVVFLEKVQVRPDDMQFGKATGIEKMLRSHQQLKDVLATENVPYVLVHPRSWQAGLNLWARTEDETAVNEVIGRILAKRKERGEKTTERQLDEIQSRAAKQVRKERYRVAAAGYYPEVKATLSNADAMLLVHFGRVKLKNDPQWVHANLPNFGKRELF